MSGFIRYKMSYYHSSDYFSPKKVCAKIVLNKVYWVQSLSLAIEFNSSTSTLFSTIFCRLFVGVRDSKKHKQQKFVIFFTFNDNFLSCSVFLLRLSTQISFQIFYWPRQPQRRLILAYFGDESLLSRRTNT